MTAANLTEQQRLELEAAAFRTLVHHLQTRKDVQNIDLMNLAGFCRNCLSKWYKAAADDLGVEVSNDQAREEIYGMPYAEWKAKYQKPCQPCPRHHEPVSMTLTDFRARLRSEHHLFTDTLAFIAEHYSYTPSAFDNGSVSNPAGQNEGSCKTLGFAILEGLSLEETLLAFGEHYRAVRDNPEGDDHANIRALQQTGLAGVHFERQPLSRRG